MRDAYLTQRLQDAVAVRRDERRVAAAMERALAALAAECLAWVQAHGTARPPALLPAWTAAIDDDVMPLLEDIYVREYDHQTALTAAGSLNAGLKARAYLRTVRNRLLAVKRWVFTRITEALRDGVQAGDSIPALAERVEHALAVAGEDTWRNRGVVVARTEVIGAYNNGRLQAGYELADLTGTPHGLVQKTWLATEDHRTRPTHRAADRQTVPLTGKFTVGGFLGRGPGDPMLPAQETIQCRCTLLIRLPGDPGYVDPAISLAASGTTAVGQCGTWPETTTSASDSPAQPSTSSTDDAAHGPGLSTFAAPSPGQSAPDSGDRTRSQTPPSDGHDGAVIVALPYQGDPIHDVGEEEKHLTLCWLGSGDDTVVSQEDVQAALAEQAAQIAPFTAGVKSTGPLGDDGAWVAFLNEGAPVAVRDRLMDSQVIADGVTGVQQHPQYTPHTTLSYDSQPDYDGDVTFDRLALWWGDDHSAVYPLAAEAMAASGAVLAFKYNPAQKRGHDGKWVKYLTGKGLLPHFGWPAGGPDDYDQWSLDLTRGKDLRDHMRGKPTPGLSQQKMDELQAAASNLKVAFDSQKPSDTNALVWYRPTRFKDTDFPTDVEPGQVIADGAPLHTEVKRNYNQPVAFAVRVPEGSKALAIAPNPNQSSDQGGLLLPPGAQYKVADVRMDGKQKIITLDLLLPEEQVQAPEGTLATVPGTPEPPEVNAPDAPGLPKGPGDALDVTSTKDLDALPEGARVVSSGHTFQKMSTGQWLDLDDPESDPYSAQEMTNPGEPIVVDSLPPEGDMASLVQELMDAPGGEPQVGDPLTDLAAVDNLPVGAQVQVEYEAGGAPIVFEKQSDGTWDEVDGDELSKGYAPDELFTPGTGDIVTVANLPEETPTPQTPTPQQVVGGESATAALAKQIGDPGYMSPESLDAVPMGTVVTDEITQEWIKTGDGGWVNADGGAASNLDLMGAMLKKAPSPQATTGQEVTSAPIMDTLPSGSMVQAVGPWGPETYVKTPSGLWSGGGGGIFYDSAGVLGNGLGSVTVTGVPGETPQALQPDAVPKIGDKVDTATVANLPTGAVITVAGDDFTKQADGTFITPGQGFSWPAASMQGATVKSLAPTSSSPTVGQQVGGDTSVLDALPAGSLVNDGVSEWFKVSNGDWAMTDYPSAAYESSFLAQYSSATVTNVGPIDPMPQPGATLGNAGSAGLAALPPGSVIHGDGAMPMVKMNDGGWVIAGPTPETESLDQEGILAGDKIVKAYPYGKVVHVASDTPAPPPPVAIDVDSSAATSHAPVLSSSDAAKVKSSVGGLPSKNAALHANGGPTDAALDTYFAVPSNSSTGNAAAYTNTKYWVLPDDVTPGAVIQDDGYGVFKDQENSVKQSGAKTVQVLIPAGTPLLDGKISGYSQDQGKSVLPAGLKYQVVSSDATAVVVQVHPDQSVTPTGKIGTQTKSVPVPSSSSSHHGMAGASPKGHTASTYALGQNSNMPSGIGPQRDESGLLTGQAAWHQTGLVKGLNAAERKAIAKHTGSSDLHNDYLRQKPGQGSKSQATWVVDGYLSAMEKIDPVEADTLMYRGFQYVETSKAGTVLTDYGLVCTSAAKHTAAKFAGHGTILHIRVPKGAKMVSGDGTNGGAVVSELEGTLPPGARFVIVGRRTSPQGSHTVELDVDYVPPPPGYKPPALGGKPIEEVVPIASVYTNPMLGTPVAPGAMVAAAGDTQERPADDTPQTRRWRFIAVPGDMVITPGTGPELLPWAEGFVPAPDPQDAYDEEDQP